MKNNYAYGSLASFLPLEENLFPMDQPSVFGRRAPIEVEIGFGTGEYLVRIARDFPGTNFLGFEQCANRAIKTLRKIHDGDLKHVRIMRMDAVWGLRYLFPEKSLSRVHCLFPCPWPKKRHAKHRLFSTQILQLINSRLIDGAQLYIVTDHRPYFEWILEHVPGSGFEIGSDIIPAKFGTKFERKWAEAGQSEFFELTLTKVAHQHGFVPEKVEMKTYFFDQVDFARVRPENVWGPVTVKFGDLLYDPGVKKAVVDAVVSEDDRAQHIWIVIVHTAKGWCVCPAAGTIVLPTEGAQKAISLVAEAVRKSSS
ncbi:MAG: tRNA (guanosine(46)-N7)-methyltransferase TrmB [Candidatus Omnitrophica bacterium]|nr:tRNA (guanosine(46)-N7)-methyltransferase TrmB [Candidatus Omnitrophota bacterium]